ncbi:hypothetical protein SprV_0200892500 [Sparganum proliferum]
MCQQPDKAYLISQSLSCRKPRADPHHSHSQSHCHCPTATNNRHRPPTPSALPQPLRRPQRPAPPPPSHLHNVPSPTDGAMPDVPSPPTVPTPATSRPMPEAPTFGRHTCLDLPHCTRTFTQRMGLLGHMRIHESGIRRSSETPTISCTPSMPSPTHTLSPSAIATSSSTTVTISETDSDATDLSCPHCPRTSTSPIDLIGHL